MKNLFTTATAFALALAIGGTVFAQSGMGGCNQCNQGVQGPQAQKPAEPTDQFRKFQIDTIDLRQAMMNKRFELQRENLKGTPDVVKLAGFKAEISSIQAKINNIRVQSGLPDNGKRDGECFKMNGACNKQNGMGGCNGQPCGQK
jgi:hypothetical protein